MVEFFTSLPEDTKFLLAHLVVEPIETHIHALQFFLFAFVIHEGGSYLFVKLEGYRSLRVSHLFDGLDDGD